MHVIFSGVYLHSVLITVSTDMSYSCPQSRQCVRCNEYQGRLMNSSPVSSREWREFQVSLARARCGDDLLPSYSQPRCIRVLSYIHVLQMLAHTSLQILIISALPHCLTLSHHSTPFNIYALRLPGCHALHDAPARTIRLLQTHPVRDMLGSSALRSRSMR